MSSATAVAQADGRVAVSLPPPSPLFPSPLGLWPLFPSPLGLWPLFPSPLGLSTGWSCSMGSVSGCRGMTLAFGTVAPSAQLGHHVADGAFQRCDVVGVDDRAQPVAVDEVVEGFLCVPPWRVAELFAEFRGVDDATEVEKAHLVGGEIDDPGSAEEAAHR